MIAGHLLEKSSQIGNQLALINEDGKMEITICCHPDCARTYIENHIPDMLFFTHVDGFSPLVCQAVQAGIRNIFVLTHAPFKKDYMVIAKHFPDGRIPDNVHFFNTTSGPLHCHCEPHNYDWKKLFRQAQIICAQ